MANENLLFRKGTLAQLQTNEATNKIAGSINFTTDEPAIYLDVEENGIVTRKRIGDLISFNTLGEFQTYLAEHKKLPTTALYYITETNALLKYTGIGETPWKQLNAMSEIEGNITDLSNTVAALQQNTYTKTEVNTELAKKADLETVNTELAKKADLETVNTELAKKADLEEFNALSSTVTVITGDYLKSTDKEALTNSIATAQTQADKGVNDAAAAQAAADTTQNEVDALEQTVTNLTNNIEATYETKAQSQEKLEAAQKAVQDLTDGQVASNTQAITDEEERALKAEQELRDSIGTTNTNLTNLSNNTSASIESLQAKDTAIEAAIAQGDSDTLDTAKSYTNEVKAALEAKDTEINTNISNLGNTLTANIATAKSEAITTVVGNESNTSADDTIYGIRKYVDEALIAADAMTFKGVLGGAGNASALPAAEDTKAGDTYKIGLLGEYAGYQCYVGDLLIAKQDGSDEYYHITSGYEDDYNTRLGVNASENKIILNSVTGNPHGSVTFATDANSSLSVSTTGVNDNNHLADSTVTFSLTWGSFGE